MTSIKSTLSARERTHGEYSDQANTAQAFKDILRSSSGYLKMNPQQREGAEMICHKLARCCAGDPYEPDHWLDIQGYAALVHQRLTPANAVEDDIKAKVSRLNAQHNMPYDESDPRN
jgi:hypothetical protein